MPLPLTDPAKGAATELEFEVAGETGLPRLALGTLDRADGTVGSGVPVMACRRCGVMSLTERG